MCLRTVHSSLRGYNHKALVQALQCATQAFEAELSKSANLMTAPQGKVWKAMWRQHWKVFVSAGLLKLVHDCVMFLGPFVLEQLLIFLEKGGTPCKQAM